MARANKSKAKKKQNEDRLEQKIKEHKAPAFNAPASKINVPTKAGKAANMGIAIKGAHAKSPAELAKTTAALKGPKPSFQFGSRAGMPNRHPNQGNNVLSNAPNASDRADPFLVKNELDNLTKAVDSSIALLAEANGNENLKSKATYTAFRKKPKILEGVHRERRTLQKLRARIKKLDQELAEALNEET